MATKEYREGALWRRWDLHVHTPGTNKNDNFEGATLEDKWSKFCDAINGYEDGISVIGVTDYWSIENYNKFLDCIKDGSITKKIDFVFPNVELRVIPVTGKGKPVNIHCIFNPKIADELEERFFQELKVHDGRHFSATRTGLTSYGRNLIGGQDDDAAYKAGVDNFVVELKNLTDLFKNDPELKKNLIIVVANKSSDGASGVVQHSEYFTDQNQSQLKVYLKQIYRLADAVFSSRPKDREYFLGLSDEFQSNCGAPKPCFHGCDAHALKELFEPDMRRYCWVKANPTFEGLLQTLNEPGDRVYIGEEPEALKVFEENKTKYIKAITVDSVPSYKKEHGVWFDGFRLSFNRQLVAIIGNKGSGKSALADVVALCGDASTPLEFLVAEKFKKNGLASKFDAAMYWDDGSQSNKSLAEDVDPSAHERVKYISQNYFEALCSDFDQIEGFRKELENVVFSHIPAEKRYGCNTFKELVDQLKGNSSIEVARVRTKLEAINEKIIALEVQRNEKHIQSLKNQLEQKQKELDAHDGISPEKVEDPSKHSNSDEQSAIGKQVDEVQKHIDELELLIKEKESRRLQLSIGRERLKQIKTRLLALSRTIDEEKKSIGEDIKDYDVSIDDLVSVSISHDKLDAITISQNSEDDALLRALDGDGTEENPGLRDEIKKKKDLKSKLLSKLGEPEKRYQKYLSDLSVWEEKRKTIVGHSTDITTLSGLNSALGYIENNLQDDLDKIRAERAKCVKEIYEAKTSLVEVYKDIKKSIDAALAENHELLGRYDVQITSSFEFGDGFSTRFQSFINQGMKGSFYGKEPGSMRLKALSDSVDLSDVDSLQQFLSAVISNLEVDQRNINKKEVRYIDDQVQDLSGFYDYLFSLDYLVEAYNLEMGGKQLQQLSPGEKGALLLIFYLLLDKDNKPLVIDQPEDNLDNQSVSRILVPFIKKAKLRRQIFMVTHNPNLAVVADAEQVIHINIEKDKDHRVVVKPGAIESPGVNRSIVDILEGTMPAFRQRDNKYMDS
ncbi:MAG: AAA family ATPase [Candidatus Thiodiazotropha endolucinida]|nr:AAA family ATPase [Candidatus Thiodiazotropha taylori]MCW4261083.1 AAA family ATPase [Candidatus Thiodiazotropha endolucinida]MCG8102347.1 AAA family ATPase [Candidatus Thiodiazotropha taylori]MCG8120891.1 AAA family ATPase [Candidatus Thiodiazotropha taylori]MCW4287670.1 AAA family ATPase [Candidatus Thiodiazotropha endolucinida]